MTAPRRKPWFLRLARAYVRRRLGAAFDGVHAAGLDRVRALASAGPLVIAANHLCWWDAFVVVALDEALGTESYCLMDAENLRTLPFFGWIGAIELDRRKPRVALRELRDAAALLDRPGRVLWIFPQGDHTPAHLRPMRLRAGVSILTGAAPAVPVVPLALNHLYRQAPQPAIVASFGAPLDARRHRGRAIVGALEERLVEELERCDRFVADDERDGFSAVIPSLRDRRVPGWGRLLARLGGVGAEPAALPAGRGEHA